MKILSRILFVLFVVLGVLIAVSNSQPVQLALWPLPNLIVLPVYLMVVFLLLLGVLMGLLLGWWGGRHHRRRAREKAAEVVRLEREVARLREVQAAQRPAAASTASGREQKAIERQSALVAPDLARPPAKGPFA